MSTVTISMAKVQQQYGKTGHEGMRWEYADIKRAAKLVGKISQHNPNVPLPRTDKIFAQAAEGKGMSWEEVPHGCEEGRTFRAQAWCPGPYVRSYWYLVWSEVAYFPGEMRLMRSDKEGHVWMHDTKSYNAQGIKAHRHDGSSCYGYQAGGCPGCNRERGAA